MQEFQSYLSYFEFLILEFQIDICFFYLTPALPPFAYAIPSHMRSFPFSYWKRLGQLRHYLQFCGYPYQINKN